ncbi:hypothetical protein ACNKHS_20200 [Shigella flexneri]
MTQHGAIRASSSRGLKRLWNVVISADLKADNALILHPSPILTTTIGIGSLWAAQTSADGKPVFARQHQVNTIRWKDSRVSRRSICSGFARRYDL